MRVVRASADAFGVSCDAHGDPCVVSIDVDDNGPGVPPDIAARLFRPFTQADASTKRSVGGVGLGLSIVRGLAELMGGSVNISSPGALGGAKVTCNLVLSKKVVRGDAAVASPTIGGDEGSSQPSAARHPQNMSTAAIPTTVGLHNKRIRE